MALLLTFATGALAQNANRSGFFIEGGVGLPVGSLPVKGTKWENNKLYLLRPSGPDVNIAIGYRRATSRVFAWELKAEASTMPSSFSNATVIALMPGIRYTTKELFGNTSMYFGFDAGVAMGQLNDDYYYYEGRYNEITLNTPKESDFSDGDFSSLGGKINLSVGFNISSSFYAGLYWDFCCIANQYSFSIDDEAYDYKGVSYKKDGNAVWGSAGVRLGVRF